MTVPPAQQYLLDLREVSKSFGGREVLRRVSARLAAGGIHGIVGNNGAGKSTLIKLITGTYSASPGSHIEINGRVAQAGYNERTARDFGVRVVHQEAPLIDSFTVSEMVAVLVGYPTSYGLVNWRKLRRFTKRVLERFDIKVSPDARAAFLSAAERALVSLAIALADLDEEGRPPLLILDEATASVPAEEARTYLDAVRLVAAKGGLVLMITHRLPEIIAYCDSATVLSDGAVVYQGTTTGMTVQKLGELMAQTSSTRREGDVKVLSRALPDSWGFDSVDTREPAVAAAPALVKVSDLHGPLVKGVSFSIAPGEVVGLSGLFGGGVSQVARLVGGVEAITHGNVEIDGRRAFGPGRVDQALRSGIVYLSANRAREGGVTTLSLQENLMLPTVGLYWGKRARERARVEEAISLLEIRPREPDLPFGLLSGGNQQKVLLAKLLLTCPRLIILDDPTVGVDPQSREVIFTVLRQVVQGGRAALVTSSEPDQLARECDRVLIISDGRVTGELVGPSISAAAIALASA